MDKIEGFSGAVLATREGAAVFRGAGGWADIAAGVPCTMDTRFPIASVSKQFTASAAMLLVEAGEISLSDPISHWLPDCPAHWHQLTLHHLLSHTSGMRHWQDVPGFDINRPDHARDLLDRLSRVPLHSRPGTTWHYSSPGYLLAARVIEFVSGQQYADFLTERVLRPLGMSSTYVGETPASAAHGYCRGRRVDAMDLAAVPGAGDLWSTVGDLARYTAAFNAGDLLALPSRAAMVTPNASMSGAWGVDGTAVAVGYGYGYAIGSLSGHVARFHTGDRPGFQSFLAWLPAFDVTLAILCNDEESDLDGLLRRLVPAVVDS